MKFIRKKGSEKLLLHQIEELRKKEEFVSEKGIPVEYTCIHECDEKEWEETREQAMYLARWFDTYSEEGYAKVKKIKVTGMPIKESPREKSRELALIGEVEVAFEPGKEVALPEKKWYGEWHTEWVNFEEGVVKITLYGSSEIIRV